MSLIDILDADIERRRNANTDLIKAMDSINATIEQFNKLDEVHRDNEKNTREALEAMYKESKHYTGKIPSVYPFSATEKYPFFGGQTDDLCNPYFPITQVQAKTFDGISPLYSPPTKTGAWQRDGNYSPKEDTVRNPAIAGILAFPDISDENGVSTGGSCSGETPPGSGTTESLCNANGGTWTPTPPEYLPGTTATEKLRAVLDPWKTVIQNIINDLYNNPGSTELTYWQSIQNKVNDIDAAIQVDVVYPNNTQDFIPGSAADIARDYFVANATNINQHIVDRAAFLEKEVSKNEDLFFGIVKLRLHQANGSFSKLQAAKSQKTINTSIIQDNNDAIRSLNLLKVKNS